MSNSTSRLLVDYFRTRFPAWLVISLPLLITAPAVVTGVVTTANEFAFALGIALLLFIEFRLWDDLTDRKQDCLDDPQRVLCRAQSIRPFVTAFVMLMLSNIALVAWRSPWQSLASLLVLHAILALWYAVRAQLRAGPVANYHVVLLKYPAFAFILGNSSRQVSMTPLFASIAVVYLVLCIAEVLHDSRLRAKRSAWICAWAEMALLVGIIIACASSMLMTGFRGEGTS